MKTFVRNVAVVAMLVLLLARCSESADPGSMIREAREFKVTGFDRITLGDGFDIKVEQGTTALVWVDGDSRNLDDLKVYVRDSTLFATYTKPANRRYNTTFTIVLPELHGIDFSGGTRSTVKGFESTGVLNIGLSGGAVCDVEAGYRSLNIAMSGASVMTLRGLGDVMDADLSGASRIQGYDFPVGRAVVRASGASDAKVTVSDELMVDASGASDVRYKGNPVVQARVSGASSVKRE